MNEPENPQAFPGETRYDHPAHGEMRFPNPGMTLRDWFAGQALAGMRAHAEGYQLMPEMAAHYAYKDADAMLAERAQVKP